MIIDFENHIFMDDQVEKTHATSTICERIWDEKSDRMNAIMHVEASQPEKYLEFMDAAGIDLAVLTTNSITGLEAMKKWNNFGAGVVKRYPERFVGFACIPPFGGKPALQELDRAVRQLGMKGVHIWTRSEGRHLDDPQLWPFYQKVSELGVPVDVHVTLEPTGFDALESDYGLHFTMARELDMCVATMRLCLGGVLEDFPDIKFIMNHFGGGIASIVERFDIYTQMAGSTGLPRFYRGKPKIKKPWREHFGKLYFNMAGREAGIGAVKCALASISPERLVMGTDWPFNYDGHAQEVRRFVDLIRQLDLPEGAAELMLGGNAARLLQINS